MGSIYRSLGLRRMLAFGVDGGLIALYALALLGFAVVINGSAPMIVTPHDPLRGEFVGFVSLTLPVILYFMVGEYRYGQTLGKYVFGLKVVARQSGGVKLLSIAVRNILKFLPWEMGHYTVHRFIAANHAHQNPGLSVYVVLVILYALVGLYAAGLFWGRHGPVYDRAAGTRVVNYQGRSA